MARRSGTLRFKLLLAFALLLVVAWSVLWFVAATVVDRQAEKIEMLAAADGATIDCAHRSVKGFPFRIEVRCGPGSRVANHAGAVTLDGLTVVGLVYNPNLVIAEVQSPVVAEQPGMPVVRAEWTLAHASTRLDFGDNAVDRFDAEVEGLTLSVGSGPQVNADSVHLNVRRHPEAPDTLDVAARVIDAVPIPGGEPVTLTLRGSVPDGAPLLAGRPEALLATLARTGLPVIIDSATVASGDMHVALAGALTLKPNGRIDGDLEVAMVGSDKDLPYVKVVAPEVERTIATVLKNVLAFAPETTVDGMKAKKLTLSIRDGRVSAGFVPLFTVPPVHIAGL
jgi:hypothetical protein